MNFKVQHKDPRTEKFVFDFARDLSLTGLFLRTHRVRPIGATLELSFPIDDLVSRARPVRLTCQVTRVTPEGLGAKFVTPVDSAVVSTLRELAGR